MADYQSVVTGDSKEAVAYALLLGIAEQENKTYTSMGTVLVKADATWVLRTYSKCLRVVSGGAPD
jgi:hypothetical protein